MLVVTIDEVNGEVYIDGGKVRVVTLGKHGSKFRLGIDAPKETLIERDKVYAERTGLEVNKKK